MAAETRANRKGGITWWAVFRQEGVLLANEGWTNLDSEDNWLSASDSAGSATELEDFRECCNDVFGK